MERKCEEEADAREKKKITDKIKSVSGIEPVCNVYTYQIERISDFVLDLLRKERLRVMEEVERRHSVSVSDIFKNWQVKID